MIQQLAFTSWKFTHKFGFPTVHIESLINQKRRLFPLGLDFAIEEPVLCNHEHEP